MKHTRILGRAACLMLIVALLALTAAPALAASKKNPGGAYVVSTSKKDRLFVHGTPGGSTVDKLKRGTVVVYKGAKSGWWKVEYRGGSGFVDRRYLTSVANLSSTKFTPVDNLWVRLKPKTNAAKLGKLKAGKKANIVKQSGTWVCIRYKGYTGWVPAKYLKAA